MEELQKLQLVAEQELIHYLEDQTREQEAIDAAAKEYMSQNTPLVRDVKAKAIEQLNHVLYIKRAREEAERTERDLGPLLTIEAPFLKTTVNKEEGRMKYKR